MQIRVVADDLPRNVAHDAPDASRPPKNFMGSMAAYEGVYAWLKKLVWI
jgi:hypothetical protein